MLVLGGRCVYDLRNLFINFYYSFKNELLIPLNSRSLSDFSIFVLLDVLSLLCSNNGKKENEII